MAEEQAVREKNIQALRRFFGEGNYAESRRDLWADDAVFELPFTPGRQVFKGLKAILERNRVSWSTHQTFRFVDLRIFPTLDPSEFFVMVGTESVEKPTGRPLRTEYINYFKLDDGRVVHRIEYHNASDWEWFDRDEHLGGAAPSTRLSREE